MDEDGVAAAVKAVVDCELTNTDGFETYQFKMGSYIDAVGASFKLNCDPDAMGLLVLSTPDMFDVAFRRWFVAKAKEFASLEEMAENVPSPIQSFLGDRFADVEEKLKVLGVAYELLHDYSMTSHRRPRILMQTCGHVAGAAFYYQPDDFRDDFWPPAKSMGPNLNFIGLSLHPIYGGHFAFRCVFIFPAIRIPFFQVKEAMPMSLLTTVEKVRLALEKFNYSWKDSGFRDFGNPSKRYSQVQMDFFGRHVADRWEVLRPWFESNEDVKKDFEI